MIEELKPFPDYFLDRMVVTVARVDGDFYINFNHRAPILGDLLQWWIDMVPTAKYLTHALEDGSMNALRVPVIYGGVDMMCHDQAGRKADASVLVAPDTDDIDVILMALQQRGVNIPWDDIYGAADTRRAG